MRTISSLTTWVMLVIASLVLSGCGPDQGDVTSTLIRNAVVIDGTGGPRVIASVRMDNDRIVGVGPLEPLPGEALIDAKGMVLAPGFIDTHSHHDYNIGEYRHMPGVLTQGVTTIVGGPDGSLGPEHLRDWQGASRSTLPPPKRKAQLLRPAKRNPRLRTWEWLASVRVPAPNRYDWPMR